MVDLRLVTGGKVYPCRAKRRDAHAPLDMGTRPTLKPPFIKK